LSGILIGDELCSALAAASPKLALVGDPALCERYQRALALFGISDAPIVAGAAPAGLWRIAVQSGLVTSWVTHV
jgi:2-dehydro-3-deoxygalactonokinase